MIERGKGKRWDRPGRSPKIAGPHAITSCFKPSTTYQVIFCGDELQRSIRIILHDHDIVAGVTIALFGRIYQVDSSQNSAPTGTHRLDSLLLNRHRETMCAIPGSLLILGNFHSLCRSIMRVCCVRDGDTLRRGRRREDS